MIRWKKGAMPDMTWHPPACKAEDRWMQRGGREHLTDLEILVGRSGQRHRAVIAVFIHLVAVIAAAAATVAMPRSRGCTFKRH